MALAGGHEHDDLEEYPLEDIPVDFFNEHGFAEELLSIQLDIVEDLHEDERGFAVKCRDVESDRRLVRFTEVFFDVL